MVPPGLFRTVSDVRLYVPTSSKFFSALPNLIIIIYKFLEEGGKIADPMVIHFGYTGNAWPQGHIIDKCRHPQRRASLSEGVILFIPNDWIRKWMYSKPRGVSRF
jgi:hypothetical protein